jgi:hypothetical protein
MKKNCQSFSPPLYITRGRLNRMCKYFRDKRVAITYEYNNSLGTHCIRQHKGKYDKFRIEEMQFNSYSDTLYRLTFFKKENIVFEQEFMNQAEFVGVGLIRELNNGPYCWFEIKRRKLFF